MGISTQRLGCAANFPPPPTFSRAAGKHKSNCLALAPVRSVKPLKWAVRVAKQQLPPKSEVQRLVDFLYEDLPHLFDDQGIDPSAYDHRVKFRDPITKHDSITGYLFNIAMLKKLFTPNFHLHSVKQVQFC